MNRSATRKSKKQKPVSERYTLTHIVANLFLAVMFTLFPLFVNLSFNATFPFIHFEQGYISIRHVKYYFFLFAAALALIVEILLLITRSDGKKQDKNPEKARRLPQLSFTDWAVLAFVLTCAVSTLLSPYLEIAFWGEDAVGGYAHGRNNGMFLMLVYAAVYFFLSRCWRYKEYVFVLLAAACGAVSLLAVLNGFYIDPLNMFALFRNDANIFYNFMTTIGNKNMFASHLCVVLPVVVTMFVHTEKRWCKAVYLAAAVLGAMAVVICDSDSALLGMGVFAAVFTVVYVRRIRRLKQFLLVLTAMLGAVKLLGVIAALTGNAYKELSAITYHIMTANGAYIALAVTALLTAALYLLDAKKPDAVLPRAVPVAVGSVLGVAVLAGVGVVVYFTAFDTKTNLGEMSRTLRFSDAWGTHRGFMWNKALEIFNGRDFLRKLFGTGPESFYYAFSPYFDELYDRFGDSSTDAAHNEYLNYLINIGIAGLASYLAFTGGALVRAFKAAKRQPVALVTASAVVAYMAQAVVNIALPIATPLFIIFVSLCEAAARQAGKERQSNDSQS